MTDFDISKIKKYVEKSNKNQFKDGAKQVLLNTFTNDAILFAFDKNKDGKISKNEFEQLSKEHYSVFANKLSGYNKSQNVDEHIYSYEELNKLLEDGFIDAKELDNGLKFCRLNRNKVYEERKGRQNPYEMSGDEIQRELDEYNQTDPSAEKLISIRKERNLIDRNSDVIDWHIGTFNQGSYGTCALLSVIENLSDEDLKNIYTKKQDEKGNTYYEINFPSDEGKKTVKITQKEVENQSLIYKGKEITGFTSGDADVRLLEMAYVKRFGTDILYNGSTTDTPIQRLTGSKDVDFNTDITEDMLKNDKVKSVRLASDDVMQSHKNNENSITLSNGEVVEIYHTSSDNVQNVGTQRLKLPDGTVIYGQHAYSVKGYDEENREVILVNPHENSTVIKVPFEVMELFYLYNAK